MPKPIFLALLITALPLAAFAIELLHALIVRRMPKWNHLLSTAAMFGALGCSLYLLFTEVLGRPHGVEQAYQQSWAWISIIGTSPVRIDFDVMVDNLTIVMLVVVTLVSSLVHLYASSYMEGEKRYSRFFSYLSLFTFSMLGLCITSNILLLFIFWELVGLCSYFLIGFYIEKKSAGDASKKAFVVNRVGDACFMAAICIVFAVLSTSWNGENVLNFTRIYESIGLLGQGTGPWVGRESLLSIVGVLFFMGCVTKSAQFPLHIWLPDAMEGPTPVSALIHAATMVAAGVYMIVRMFPLLVGQGYLSGDWFHSDALTVVALVGGFTSIFAGSIALVQKDLKKGLAYSTCSQLGYMAMAVGVGSTTGGMFHLFTHAFFKACMFLGAGSVIHAVHSQLMGDMGGLRRKMPITFWTFFISTLAIAGVPLTSGFLSKEMVLTSALAYSKLHHGSLLHSLPFWMAATTAGLTAFYMFRIVFLTFFG
ncbi:MAG TPA: NADH-quinone oxidoreductase subunit L, partial [Planctomycetota bacterium]|nr:NADH-quinone oxidoreductase subunit L [Planctomycetota bacterium]